MIGCGSSMGLQRFASLSYPLPSYTQDLSLESSPFRFPNFFADDMALRIGQVLRGGKGKYELLEQLKGFSVFKARVLSNPSIHGEWYGSAHVI